MVLSEPVPRPRRLLEDAASPSSLAPVAGALTGLRPRRCLPESPSEPSSLPLPSPRLRFFPLTPLPAALSSEPLLPLPEFALVGAVVDETCVELVDRNFAPLFELPVLVEVVVA